MPYPPPNAYITPIGQEYSGCMDKIKMGILMGLCVGVASGALFGGFSALRFGIRGKELMHAVGKSMVQGGGTFGAFMGIGTGIRC